MNASQPTTQTIETILAMAPVVPVVVIDQVESAVPLAEALVAGGLPAIEVTLRTPAALRSIEMIAASITGAVVGAGTVIDPSQALEVRDAGASFIVSPGSYHELTSAIRESGVPYLPGVATSSEAMHLLAQGFVYQKLFPAAVVGGVAMLKALGAPLAAIRFCPTGGITEATATEYLALDNVICVGGSWIAPRELQAAGDWAEIERRARVAAGMRRSSSFSSSADRQASGSIMSST